MNEAPPTDIESSDAAAFSERDPKARAVELLISDILRIGVLISLAVVVLGTVITFTHHRELLSRPESLAGVTRPGARFPHTLGSIYHELRHFHGQAIVMIGLLLLIATPVLRVAVSIFAFVYEHDRRYVIITSIVFVLLVLSFVLGKVE